MLVVDDDTDTAQTFASLLTEMGHEATFLTDPLAVMEATKRVKPHLVFLDIGMPGMNGWELASLLRKHYPQHEALRLVALTGQADDEARIKSRKAGFDAHVTKPIEPRLVESILKQLGGHC